VTTTLVLALAASGCRATGRAANAYFDWGGKTFTTNPVSVAPYFLGFICFFIAGLPLDIFTWFGTSLAWHEGSGEDYQNAALSPSVFMGVSGGVLLSAPFFPFGIPWWNPNREDAEAPPPPSAPAPPATSADKATEPLPADDPRDSGGAPAGAPGR
jgi:hypothetical protein